jgi:hypothetical protein
MHGKNENMHAPCTRKHELQEKDDDDFVVKLQRKF